jgi:malonyl-CoA O-methyltransferase
MAERTSDDDSRDLDPRAVRRSFARAAATYDAAAVLQREVGRRMAEKLDVVKLAPTAILDAGCGTGDAQAHLSLRYPDARQIALDIALPMLALARTKGRARAREGRSVLARILSAVTPAPREPDYVCGDLARLPFAAGAFDLAWSNLALQWVDDLPQALSDLSRVLREGGLVSFSTFGPDTLRELRSAFAGIDRFSHVSRFVDMHDIGDMLVAAGFGDPVMHMEYVTLTYPDSKAMLRDLKAIGATNATRLRPKALMGRRRWERALAALEATRREGRLPATFEVIYGHAWKAAPRRTPEGHAIVRFER